MKGEKTKHGRRKPPLDDECVSASALDWALKHVRRYDDTDIFPVPFEYRAIAADWTVIRQALSSQNIAKVPLRGNISLATPKTSFGFRVAHQLDPRDTLLYTASVYEMGPYIEANRESRTVACSYRFEPTKEGGFFPRDNGWGTFTAQSRELAESSKYVLSVDIADFFNQIYQHRLCGALETAGISKARAQNFEKFIRRFTAKESQGIPVGPSASNLLAECCLADVDSTLRDLKLSFVRYIDDFRVFSRERPPLIEALQQITTLLHRNHRLAIQGGKTQLEKAKEFVRRRFDDPAREFQVEMEDRLEELAEQLNEEMEYGEMSIDDIDDEQLRSQMYECLEDLFRAALKARPVRYGTLRYLLREAGGWRSRRIYPLILDNVEVLMPVFGDLCKYVAKTVPPIEKYARPIGEALLKGAERSDYSSSDFVAMWALSLFEKHPKLMSFSKAMAFSESRPELGLRPQALLAKTHSKGHWVRRHKEGLMELGPWDRRALIWSASALPASERNAWLSAVESQCSDILDRAVAKGVRGGA